KRKVFDRQLLRAARQRVELLDDELPEHDADLGFVRAVAPAVTRTRCSGDVEPGETLGLGLAQWTGNDARLDADREDGARTLAENGIRAGEHLRRVALTVAIEHLVANLAQRLLRRIGDAVRRLNAADDLQERDRP